MKSGKPIRGITPERAQQILQQSDVHVTLQQASMVLALMYRWSEMELEKLNKEK